MLNVEYSISNIQQTTHKLETDKTVGIGKAKYDSKRIEIEKKSDKQKPIVHYDYLYLENKKWLREIFNYLFVLK